MAETFSCGVVNYGKGSISVYHKIFARTENNFVWQLVESARIQHFITNDHAPFHLWRREMCSNMKMAQNSLNIIVYKICFCLLCLY